MPKKAKTTRRKQKWSGNGEDNYRKGSEIYGPNFEDWLKTPLAQMALKTKNETGYYKYYNDFLDVYNFRIPSNVTEATRAYCRNPKTDTAVGKWLRDNSTPLLKTGVKVIGKVLGFPDIVGDTVGGVIGIALNKANQEGGRTHMRRPKSKAPQHGSGGTVYKTQPYPIHNSIYVQRRIPQMGGSSPFLLTDNSSFNSVKFYSQINI